MEGSNPLDLTIRELLKSHRAMGSDYTTLLSRDGEEGPVLWAVVAATGEEAAALERFTDTECDEDSQPDLSALVQTAIKYGAVLQASGEDEDGAPLFRVVVAAGEQAAELEERVRPMTAEGEDDPDPYREAIVRTLREINAAAEADMLRGNPVTGAHHRAIEAKLRELGA
ncbi:MAG: hypothetical protein ACK47B_23595 [Armatimonadota bacterium]